MHNVAESKCISYLLSGRMGYSEMHSSVQIKFTVFSAGVMNPLGQGNRALETQGTNEFFMEQSSLLWREVDV